MIPSFFPADLFLTELFTHTSLRICNRFERYFFTHRLDAMIVKWIIEVTDKVKYIDRNVGDDRSRSLSESASPLATEPNTLMLRAP